jgi:hypothetical protein
MYTQTGTDEYRTTDKLIVCGTVPEQLNATDESPFKNLGSPENAETVSPATTGRGPA